MKVVMDEMSILDPSTGEARYEIDKEGKVVDLVEDKDEDQSTEENKRK